MMKFKYIGFILIALVAEAKGQIKPVTAGYPSALKVVPLPLVGTDNLPFSMQATFAPKRPMTTIEQVANTGNRREEINKEYEYYDGLGRIAQNVQWQSSPKTNGISYDLVTPSTFDAFDRRTQEFMSYRSSDTSALIKFDAFSAQNTFWSSLLPGENVFYRQTEYEASPLGRVNAEYKFGNSWAGSGRGIRKSYEFNTVADSVWQLYVTDANAGVYTASIFPKGKLTKSVTMDEDSNRLIIYANFNGEVILRAVEHTRGLPGLQGFSQTYYVYSDAGRLCYVIQPEGVKQLQQSNWNIVYTSWVGSDVERKQCFSYSYGQHGNIIAKHMPGGGLIEMVFDQNNNMRMFRDSILKSQGKWKAFSYDALNRVSLVEMYNITSDRATLAQYFDSDPDFSPSAVGTFAAYIKEYRYDDYSWQINMENEEAMTFDSTQANGFFPPSDVVYPFARRCTAAGQVRGRLTYTNENLEDFSGSSKTMYYDEDGRVIQKVSSGGARGTEMLSTQYDFQGNVICERSSVTNFSMPSMNSTVLHKNYYDHASRLSKRTTQANNGPVVTTDSSGYDQIGRLIYRGIGQKKEQSGYVSSPIDSLKIEYNVNNLVSAINRSFCTGINNTGYFGEVISYDYGFSKSVYNGNVSGIQWRGIGDTVQRAYGFGYDASNRLLNADFTQRESGAWSQGNMNFSTAYGNGVSATSAYDLNGNIKSLKNYGWAGTGSKLIDDLRYTYVSGENRLSGVADSAISTTDFKLGDFQDGVAVADEYTYNGNGCQTRDLNKKITKIEYSRNNRPIKINIAGTGQITFLYDEDDQKLEKTIIDSTAGNKVIKTLYYKDMVYEKLGNDSTRIAYISHPQGRIRFNATGAVYDYYVNDHLGNVRALLTEAVQTYVYPATTLEGSVKDTNTAASVENLYYAIDTNNVVNQPSGFFAHTNNNGFTNPNPKGNQMATSQKVYKLNGTSTGKRGLDFVAKVMAGDSISVYAYSYYATKTPSKNYLPALSILDGLVGGVTGLGGVHGISGSDLLGINGAGLTSYLTTRPASDSVPASFVNILWFDDQLKFVKASCSIVSVPSGGKTHANDASSMLGQPAPKSGYVYVFVSNESATDVYFDNLQVVHKKGRLSDEYHYYPTGQLMTAISSSSGIIAENKMRFSNKEIQHDEFGKGKGLDWYDYGARMYDVQLGRWMAIDPLADKSRRFSPYVFSNNNPLRFVDPDGMAAWDVTLTEKKQEGLEELQKSVAGQMTLSMDANGKLSYTGVRDELGLEVPLDENAQKLADAINDHTIDVQVRVTESFFTKAGRPLIGGALVSTEVKDKTTTTGEASSANKVVTNQEVRLSQIQKISNYHGKPGGDMLHEVTESYMAGKNTQRTNVEYVADDNCETEYKAAHNAAAPQTGTVYQQPMLDNNTPAPMGTKHYPLELIYIWQPGKAPLGIIFQDSKEALQKMLLQQTILQQLQR